MPRAGRIIAVFTPMISPRELTSGPPEFPGVQRFIRLDNIIDESAGVGTHRAAQRAHHTGGHGLVKAEGTADGHSDLSNAYRFRIAQTRMHELSRGPERHSDLGKAET
jgi:hypothetical protein